MQPRQLVEKLEQRLAELLPEHVLAVPQGAKSPPVLERDHSAGHYTEFGFALLLGEELMPPK